MTSLSVLDLSSNGKLYSLPEEVSSLVSLQLLNLSGTSIIQLPTGLKKLVKLIHLDLEFTPFLEGIDVIASLLNLQVLRLYKSAVPVDLDIMEDIILLKSLKELSLTVKEVTVLQRLQSIHQLASCIRRLHLRGIKITEGGISSLTSGLRELDISVCNLPLEITIDWRRETLQSDNIEKIQQFRNIRTVHLYSCRGLKDLTWLLVAPSLSLLRLDSCPEMEEVISEKKAMAQLGLTSEQPFQNLTSLYLDALPALESIYWNPLPFPVLEYLRIRGCPKLTRLPLNFESTKGDRFKIDIDRRSIQGVKWEDDATERRVFSQMDDMSVPSTVANEKEMKESAKAHEREIRMLEDTLKHTAANHERTIRQRREISQLPLMEDMLKHTAENRQMKEEILRRQRMEDSQKQNAANLDREIRQMREESQRIQAHREQLVHQQAKMFQQPAPPRQPECNIM
ncbi:unnamed protein product [Microthlaspi erraticum]|uniref:Uncharacterized protein n=1 Tax=Microthlaspi erraticum TaxID=1685480 RepID=A0A6D2I8S2_9BRAS|nr:unnamed protein product [Microthlaspi erraticum]